MIIHLFYFIILAVFNYKLLPFVGVFSIATGNFNSIEWDEKALIEELNRRLLRQKEPSPPKSNYLPVNLYPNLHICNDQHEAYSASYLINKEHLIQQFTGFNLSWVNCEMGSYVLMYSITEKNGKITNVKKSPYGNGTVIQSLDIFDFSVIHLSVYERLQRRWADFIKSKDVKTGNIDPVIKSVEILKKRALLHRATYIFNESKVEENYIRRKYNKTIVIMPFLGVDMGAGHSKLSNRFQYLAACFWSFYHVMNI